MNAPRTKGIWFICSFEIVSFVFGLVSLIAIQTKRLPLPINEQVYLDNLGSMTYLFSALSLVNVIGSVRLFLLKKDAVCFYFFKFGSGIFAIVYNVFFTNWLLTHDRGPVIFGTIIGLFIQLVFLGYVIKVQKAGLLR